MLLSSLATAQLLLIMVLESSFGKALDDPPTLEWTRKRGCTPSLSCLSVANLCTIKKSFVCGDGCLASVLLLLWLCGARKSVRRLHIVNRVILRHRPSKRNMAMKNAMNNNNTKSPILYFDEGNHSWWLSEDYSLLMDYVFFSNLRWYVSILVDQMRWQIRILLYRMTSRVRSGTD